MHADVIVVGAGVVGASIAYALTEVGARVTIIDQAAGSGATASGMGHIVVMDDSPAQFALTSYSRTLLHELLPQLSPDCEVDVCGTLWLAEDDAQLALVRDKAAFHQTHGVRVEMLNDTDLQRAEPQLRHGLAGALRVPDDCVVYPPALSHWLLRAACARGAQLVRDGVSRIGAGTVVTNTGSYSAGSVVLATGAAAAALVPELPVVPRKGHLVVTDRYPGFCTHQLVELGYLQSAHTLTNESVAFNVQPRRTGQLLIGSSRELVGWDARVNRAIVTRMLQRAIAYMPALARITALRTWTGFRPATEDKLPLVGAWDAIRGLWLAVGHEGLGITTALGTARILSDLMHGRTPGIDAAPFAPARVFAAARP